MLVVAKRAPSPSEPHSKDRDARDTAKDMMEGSFGTPSSCITKEEEEEEELDIAGEGEVDLGATNHLSLRPVSSK